MTDKVYTVSFKEVRKIKDPLPFADTIYKNFIHLAKTEQLGHSKEEIMKLLTNENFIGFLVYDQDKKIIAYLIGEVKNLNDSRVVYYITYVFVCSKFRGKKLGSQLLDILISKCKEWGVKFILLTCDKYDKKVYHFYIKRGFSKDPILGNDSRHQVLLLIIDE
jgi:GNAT superfamily N-acetyltransferase